MGRFPNRVLYAIDSDFAAAKAEMATMSINVLEAQIFSGTTNILTRYNQLTGGQKGFAQLGSYTPSATGGAFSIAAASAISAIVNGVKNHPQNSHIYYIFDEPNLAALATSSQDLCRDTIRARRDLIHSLDTHPDTKVVGADFRQAQLDPVASGRAGGMWDGVIDEVIISLYPFPNAVATSSTIPTAAGWCDAAGMPYSGVLSVHNYKDTTPAYPTVAQMQFAVDQWSATNSVDLWVYIWSDAWDASDTSSPNTQLRDDPTMQAALGAKLSDDSGTGTLTLSGAAAQAYTSTGSRTGTITRTGTATQAYTSAASRSGTVTLSGSKAQAYTSTHSRSGTVTLSGTAVQTFFAAASRSGTINLTGTGVESYSASGGTTYNDSAQGALTASGTTTQSFTATASMPGTVTFTGTGIESYVVPGTNDDSGSGTLVFAGSGVESYQPPVPQPEPIIRPLVGVIIGPMGIGDQPPQMIKERPWR